MSHHLCPVCGSSLEQIHRRTIDRLISQFYRVHRFRCINSECRWEGLLHIKTKKKQMQWWVWVLIAFLSFVIGFVLLGRLANLPSMIIDVINKFP